MEGKTTTQWARVATYSGKLVENIVQAFCRDILAEAMLRLEEFGHEIVMHVHDEAVVEDKIGAIDLHDIESKLSIVPAWAEGMPLEAEGWQGRRYRK